MVEDDIQAVREERRLVFSAFCFRFEITRQSKTELIVGPELMASTCPVPSPR